MFHFEKKLCCVSSPGTANNTSQNFLLINGFTEHFAPRHLAKKSEVIQYANDNNIDLTGFTFFSCFVDFSGLYHFKTSYDHCLKTYNSLCREENTELTTRIRITCFSDYINHLENWIEDWDVNNPQLFVDLNDYLGGPMLLVKVQQLKEFLEDQGFTNVSDVSYASTDLIQTYNIPPEIRTRQSIVYANNRAYKLANQWIP